MTSKLLLKSTPLSKGALLLVMFELRFHIKVLGNVSKNFDATVVYHLPSQHVTKKYYIVLYITCNLLSRFHKNISPRTNS